MSIYLDNAATSFPKPEAVYIAAERALRETGANPGRGGHQPALAAARLIFESREAVARLFDIGDAARIAFTASATEALNTALFGVLRPGDRVVTSSMEHNAVTRPLRALQERGVEVVKVAADGRGLLDPEALRRACRAAPTRLVVLSHCSNVTGSRQPIEEIAPWCRREGILFLLDAAQSAGLMPIHPEALGIDLLAAPGHKGLLAPPGTGFLYVRPGLELTPLIYGGTGGNSQSELPPEEMPERLEAGTQNTPGLAGLKAAAELLLQHGLAAIQARESALLARLLSGLEQLPGVELYGSRDPRSHGGALSFNLDGRDPSEVGYLLDHQHGIFCRTGLHCAPDAHRTIGTFPRGTVRVSPGFFTTVEEIDLFLAAVAEVAAHPLS
ncbi:MAG: aminotransferase class V-fold PLP-dependent enzyme [Desulfuromonadales bacterium]|nr:aminotransferase class V-fold PLP-dependent enzyme [Desulfuromonadales bacterium]